MYVHRSTCRLCLSDKLTQVLSLTPTPPANAFVSAEQLNEKQSVFPLDVYFCEECFHAQLLDVVDPTILFENYVYVSGTSPVFVDHFRKYTEELVSFSKLDSTSSVLEIGSNDGTMLRFFKDRGIRVIGVDPAKKIAAQATASGIETLSEFFTDHTVAQIKSTVGNFVR